MLLPPGACSLWAVPEPHSFPTDLGNGLALALEGRSEGFDLLLTALGHAWVRYLTVRGLLGWTFAGVERRLKDVAEGSGAVRIVFFTRPSVPPRVLRGEGPTERKACQQVAEKSWEALSQLTSEPTTTAEDTALYQLEEVTALLFMASTFGLRLLTPHPFALLWAVGVRWREWLYEVDTTTWILRDERRGVHPRRARVMLFGRDDPNRPGGYGIRLFHEKHERMCVGEKGTIAEVVAPVATLAAARLSTPTWTKGADDLVKAEGNVQEAAEFFAFAINDLLSWSSSARASKEFP